MSYSSHLSQLVNSLSEEARAGLAHNIPGSNASTEWILENMAAPTTTLTTAEVGNLLGVSQDPRTGIYSPDWRKVRSTITQYRALEDDASPADVLVFQQLVHRFDDGRGRNLLHLASGYEPPPPTNYEDSFGFASLFSSSSRNPSQSSMLRMAMMGMQPRQQVSPVSKEFLVDITRALLRAWPEAAQEKDQEVNYILEFFMHMHILKHFADKLINSLLSLLHKFHATGYATSSPRCERRTSDSNNFGGAPSISRCRDVRRAPELSSSSSCPVQSLNVGQESNNGDHSGTFVCLSRGRRNKGHGNQLSLALRCQVRARR